MCTALTSDAAKDGTDLEVCMSGVRIAVPVSFHVTAVDKEERRLGSDYVAVKVKCVLSVVWRVLDKWN